MNPKPIVVIELNQESSAETYDKCVEMAHKILIDEYHVIVVQGGSVKVYYPNQLFPYLYQKLKAWLTLKIKKKKQS